jgi:hypothetical protein
MAETKDFSCPELCCGVQDARGPRRAQQDHPQEANRRPTGTATAAEKDSLT